MISARAWQRMLSGRRLDLLDPSPLDVELSDIAHGLARVARWNGQTLSSGQLAKVYGFTDADMELRFSTETIEGLEGAVPLRYVFDEGHHLFDASDNAFAAHLSGQETAELRRWLLGAQTRRGGGASRMRGLRRRMEEFAQQMQGAQRVAWADNAIKLAVDMTVAGLIDLGLDAEWLRSFVRGLGLGDVDIRIEAVNRRGIACSHIRFDLPDEKAHRHLKHVVEIIDRSNTSALTKERARGAFMAMP